jgi:hypothetical protein
VNDPAILLTGSDSLSSQDCNLGKLLDFFGVSWRPSTIAELFADYNGVAQSDLRLLCSSDHFSGLMTDLEMSSDRARRWHEQIHSVFVYAGKDIAALGKLAEIRTGTDTSSESHSGAACFAISEKLPEFCGVMAGVRIAADEVDVALTFAPAAGSRHVDIISLNHSAVFVKLEYEGVPVFLSASKRIIDTESDLPDGIFDVRQHVLQAVSPVLYIKWAFAGTCWTAPEKSACLIIDDPLLKPRYGFVHYGELLSLMQRHKFSTNIAFIPWNWRRSDSRVTRLFRENPQYYSISVHGCAHTQAEFGSDDSERLYGKARRALARMTQHESSTGIAHDRVMVFPQGVFSEAAMGVLKRTDLIAAVNNDTISSNSNPRAITVADVWDTAIMAYDNFPLFTRRYPWSGIENFAFDSLLGKPIVIVVHHDSCRDHCERLIAFIEQVNSLACPLHWRSLGDLVRRSCRQRALSPDVTQVEMYGKELLIENLSNRTKQFLIRRRERDPSAIMGVRVDRNPISWTYRGDRIQFEVELKGGEHATIRVDFHELNEAEETAEDLNYTARTMLRRYLCELRDNYLHKLTSSSSNGN